MRVIIADDHALFRDSLRSLLTLRGLEVVAEASTGRDAIRLSDQFRPDVVLMDLDMPDIGGLEATRHIVREMPDVKVVVLTASNEDADLFEAIKGGAKGYLVKDLPADTFLELLEGLSRGEPALMPQLAQRLLDEFARPKVAASARSRHPDALTDRELEVLEAMTDGITSNRNLAQHFGVSENTVKFHMRNILDKLHLKNRTQVVGFALRRGLVKPNDPPRP